MEGLEIIEDPKEIEPLIVIALEKKETKYKNNAKEILRYFCKDHK